MAGALEGILVHVHVKESDKNSRMEISDLLMEISMSYSANNEKLRKELGL